uniref:Tc1-like transposase DDE domain-containing protein n=1 Tax=Gadus morhua TaxID=8049 RepID=A0A8C5FEW1_GADMO
MWGNFMFSDESRFCLRQLELKVKVWRRCGERYADCCPDRTTYIGGGSVMVWGGVSLTGKTRLVIIGGNLNAERYGNEILQPVAIPYVHGLGPNSILQDDNARPHRAGNPDLNPIEHLWDQLGRAVRARGLHGDVSLLCVRIEGFLLAVAMPTQWAIQIG